MFDHMRSASFLALVLVAGSTIVPRAQAPDDRAAVLQRIEAKRATYADVAKQIWSFAEVGYQEEKSSALLQQQLQAAGFSVTPRVADIPTAFVATFGSGKPVIGIIGEYDALPGLSQQSTSQRSPVNENAPGHGCGHNLLGTGSLAAHAAAAPDKGRSALDAVEAMDYMVNMMREHVPQETRIHYIITRGGAAPNVVPDFAEAYYYARQPDMRILEGIWDRIVNAAKGAALGTGTTMELEVTGAVWNVLSNEYLSGVMHKNLERVGGFTYTAEEQTFAEEIRKTLTEQPTVALGSQDRVQPMRTGTVGSASSDLADVSWNVPTVEVRGATFVPGVPAHSWQATACAGGTIGVKGMMVAAKSMALTAIDLFTDPTHIQKARAEFDAKRGPSFVYSTKLGDRKPALDYRK